MRAELRVLGVPVLRRAIGKTARAVHLQPKRLALLAYLALTPRGGWCRRHALIGLFWPECPEDDARNALSQALHGLRQALGARALATRGHEEIGLVPGILWCDGVALEEAVSAGRHEEALSLYRGPLLDGLHVASVPAFDDWVAAEREHLRLRAAEAASMLARAEQACGRTARSLHWLKRLLDLSPDDESALRELMTVRRSSGDPVGALREYQAFERRLLRDLDVAPSGQTRVLARQIRQELRPPPSAPDDSGADDAYWRGLVCWSRRTPDDLRKAAVHFRDAIARDPSSARAHSALAMALSALGGAYYDVERPDRVYPEMKTAVARALEIDANHAEALASQAVIQALYERDWPAADASSARACGIAPDNALVHHARAVVALYSGRVPEAIASIGRATKLEPFVLGYQEIKGWYLYLARRYAEAIRRLQQLLDLEPRLYLARVALGHAHVARGEMPDAERCYASAMEVVGRHPYVLASLGVLFARTSRRQDASRILAELAECSTGRYVRPTYFAAVHAVLGDRDAAFICLQQAIAERDSHVTSIACDPSFDVLRDDRRFLALLSRLGLRAPA